MMDTSDSSGGVYPQLRQIREMIAEVSGVLESDLQLVREGWSKLRQARETVMKKFLKTDGNSPLTRSARNQATTVADDAELSTMEDGDSLADICVSDDNSSSDLRGDADRAERSKSASSSTFGKETPLGGTTEKLNVSSGEQKATGETHSIHFSDAKHSEFAHRSSTKQEANAPHVCKHIVNACTRPHTMKKNALHLHERGTYCVPQAISRGSATSRLTGRGKTNANDLQSHRTRWASQTRSRNMVSSVKRSQLPYSLAETQSFWINVWPCFGTFSSRSCVPSRIVVHRNFFYMEDVTEKAAAATNCRPAPRVLYEPHGRPVCSVWQLLPGQHYLIYPGGALYRRENIPEALLRELIWSAQAKILERRLSSKRTAL